MRALLPLLLLTACFDPKLRSDLACEPGTLACPDGYGCSAGGTCVSKSILDVDAGFACDPVANTGCGAGKKCTVADGVVQCLTPGVGGQGDTCSGSASSDMCQTNFACFARRGGAPTCRKLCTPGPATVCPDEHADTTFCINVHGFPFGACTAPCDLLTSLECQTSQGCFATVDGPACIEAGTAPPGTACNEASPDVCTRGSTCMKLAGVSRCYQHCSIGGTPACTTGTCTAFSRTGVPSSVGVCM